MKFICNVIGFCLSLNVIGSYGLRILGIFPLPMKSHLSLPEQLMKGLAAKGHQVDVYSHFPQKKFIDNYNDFSLEGSLPIFSNNLTYESIKKEFIDSTLEYWYADYGHRVCELMDLPIFQKLIQNHSKLEPPYDIFITTITTHYCYLAWGQYLKVPLVGISVAPLSDWSYYAFGSPLNLATDVSIYSSYTPPLTFLQRLDNLINSYSFTYDFEKYVKGQDKYVEKYFGSGYPSVVEMQKNISLALVNYDQTLNGLRTFAPMVLPVSGLHISNGTNETLPQNVKTWLDDSEHGCIYFTFGSMAKIETFPKPVLEVFYKSFEKISPVRVLMKVARPEELPPGLPSNVLTQPWLQQTQILKHKNVKVFVTHGGLMSTQESIYYGVPMVGIPLFYDQPYNIASYVRKNIAIMVDITKMTEESFTNALNEILYNPVYRESMKKVSAKFKDRPMSPLDTAIYWIEYIHRHGKDSLKLPIVDLPWWQASLLDIYGFIVTMVALMSYIIVKVIKRLIGLATRLINIKSETKKKNK